MKNKPLSMFGDNGHSKRLIAKFNKIGKHFDVTELPILLEYWMDDGDLESFTDMLEERFHSNFNEYVIEYNIRSLCGTKAYSAVIIDKKEFGSDFDDMLSYENLHELQEDGSHYYLEQDMEGRRADKGNQGVIYDRAWIRSPKEGKEFLRYLEANL
jgi:hypothetical protein